MFFLKRHKLEVQLMQEIKAYAGVKEFPYEDAVSISKVLTAYHNGNTDMYYLLFSGLSVLEKYPDLRENWDELMIRYKKLGLFPGWDIEV